MELDLVSLAYSFAVGVGAFFNPCGFIMLPSYVAYYLAAGEPTSTSIGRRALRGLTVGAVVGGGFMVVFLLLGLTLSVVGTLLAGYVPWLGLGASVVLIVLGGGMLLGKSWALPWRFDRLLERFNREQSQDSHKFYFFYGMMYALASVSCTLPLFLAVVVQAFSLSVLNGVIHFLAYGLGMTLMMLALSLATAFSKNAVSQWISPLMRWMPRVSGAVLVAAGIYLFVYNWSAGLF